MKKIIIFVAVLLFIVPSACAATLDDVSDYAAILGGSELVNGNERDPYIQYKQDNCIITIKQEKDKLVAVFVQGSGDQFLAYCSAALAAFDPKGKTTSLGELMIMYLMAHNQEGHQDGQTSNGFFFFLEPKEDVFIFSIME